MASANQNPEQQEEIVQKIELRLSNTIYYIDFYQRDYKWTEEPVARLLDIPGTT
jgi:uncharacterized protein with ParB-like and HNH nuclease domain